MGAVFMRPAYRGPGELAPHICGAFIQYLACLGAAWTRCSNRRQDPGPWCPSAVNGDAGSATLIAITR
jgi:hypothetical protein